MVTAYIALGSNISKREEFLSEAVGMLHNHEEINVTKKSMVFETEPVGFTDQSDFLNMVVEVQTNLPPLDLLNYCQVIEEELGRRRVMKWGPRTIDLDILLYNHENIKAERLIIPHPYMHKRAFVMVPLANVKGGALLPNFNQTAQDILDRLPREEVRGVRFWGKI